MFGVDPKTVTRWADAGHVRSLRTAGGHRRFRRADVLELLGDANPAVVVEPATSDAADSYRHADMW
jgi:excisionase family DNA binding protein